MLSATRSPLTFSSAARAARIRKCRHDVCPLTRLPYSSYRRRHRRPLRHARTRPRPAPCTTPTPRLIISCSSSFSDERGHRRFERDLLAHVQRRQRLVERLHAELLLAGLHRRVDLVDLVLADQVADGGRRHQDLQRHDAPAAARLRQQRLTDDAFEHERELRADLRLLVRREHVDDAVDRLRRGVRVQRANVKWPVSAMRSAASIVSRSRISPMSTTSGSSRSAARSAFAEALACRRAPRAG